MLKPRLALRNVTILRLRKTKRPRTVPVARLPIRTDNQRAQNVAIPFAGDAFRPAPNFTTARATQRVKRKWIRLPANCDSYFTITRQTPARF